MLENSLYFGHSHSSFCLKIKVQKQGEEERALKLRARGAENSNQAFVLMHEESISH